MTRKIETTYWATTNTFFVDIFVLLDNSPFRDLEGLKEEITKAGYNPDRNPVIIAEEIAISINCGSKKKYGSRLILYIKLE